MLPKMDPVYYATKSNIWSSDNLLLHHNKQMEFIEKIFMALSNIDMTNTMRTDELIRNYANFLDMCSKHKDTYIIPTLSEDFVWHAHMLNHDIYVKDCMKMFGKILEHNIDTSGLEKNSQQIRNKNTNNPTKSYIYSGCANCFGYKPSDIFNPVNEWNKKNPSSPYWYTSQRHD